ncbi:OmpA family protein [Actinocorallia populi]|uniref:OmpA family protein n=1 Tax=Actinocorallia populi TaxID=2079200 RepID=UPI000D094F26|nr:OmpA family protein [Actinocorallia populi]
MRGLIAAVLLAAALPGAAAAEPGPAASIETSVLDLSPAVPDILLAESVIPLEEEAQTDAGTRIRISSDVLFEFDSATLTPQARAHLARLAERLKERRVRIGGYTDALGETAYNRRLSQRRADAVKDELARLGVTDLTAHGHGEARPVEPNEINGKDNPRGRAANRRVELVFGP